MDKHCLSVSSYSQFKENGIVWRDYICISLFLVPAAYHVAKAFMDSTV